MKAYVIVWENNTFGHQAVKGHTWVGHAALNIGDTFGSKQKRLNNYVSWWPGGGENGVSLFTKAGDKTASFPEDMELEEYLPDHVISLEIDEGKRQKMIAAWKEVYMPTNGKQEYNFLRKNCSTIVSRILHAGGFLTKKWSIGTQWVWSPADVRMLARRVGGHYMRWADVLNLLEESGVKGDTLLKFREHETKHGAKKKPDCMLAQMKARSGNLCTTGAPCEFQTEATEFYWKNKK